MARRFFSKSIHCLLFVLFGASAGAQDSLTIENAIAYTLRNNYDIYLAKEDSAIAAINLDYRNSAFLPRLSAAATYLRNSNAQRQTLADGSKRERDGIQSSNLTASVNLTWTLFDGFRMFRLRDQLDQAVKLGNASIKNAVIASVATAVINYYDIVRQKQQLRNIEEQLQFARERLRLAQYRFDIGVGIKPDVLQAQIDVNAREAARLTQLTVIEQRRQELNRTMNVAPDVGYNVGDTIPTSNNLVLGGILNDVEVNNPQLELSRLNINAAELNVQLARANRFPTLNFLSAYNFNRSSNNTVVNPFQPLFSLNRGFNYGLSLSIPIANNFTVRQQIRQAELAVNFRTLQLQNQQSLLKTEVVTNFQSYQNQQKVIALLDSSVALARENLFIEQERYRLGRTTVIELRTAEQNLANIITDLINARYNLKVAETALLRLSGDLVK